MTKVRVSLSLSEELVKEIDSRIDGLHIRSRSDAIERILKEFVTTRKTAVFLAGGDPKKLTVKKLNTIRPLVDIGRKKLIEDIISKCREAGFVNIIIVGSSSIITKLFEVLNKGEKYGVKIIYVQETKNLGTAKTLELAREYLKSDFLFLPCDHYFDFDLKKLHEFHLINGGLVTLAVHTRRNFEWSHGVVDMEGYKIIDFEETPKKAKTYLSSTFIGFMKNDVFNLIPPGDVQWSLQKNVFPKLAKEGKLIGYPVAGNWVNVHTKEDVDKVLNMI